MLRLIILLHFITSSIFAICPEKGVRISSKDDIIYFNSNFPGCKYISGNLIIDGFHTQQPNVYDLDTFSITSALGTSMQYDGLRNITKINGDLIITRTRLESLRGLDNLQEVTGNITFMDCTFSDKTILRNLQTVGGSIELVRLNVDSISAFNSISKINGNLNIQQCVIPESNILKNLRYIEGGLSIKSNSWGKKISLGKVEKIKGYLEVRQRDLSDFSVFSSLKSVGKLTIAKCHTLKNFKGLENLLIVEGTLSIWENDGIKNFTGLTNLEKVGGALYVVENWSIRDFRGLENLSNVGEYIEIRQNRSLISLAGLENIDSKSLSTSRSSEYKIVLTKNELLSGCEISSVCSTLNVDGQYVNIRNNHKGCNSNSEVEAMCSVIEK